MPPFPSQPQPVQAPQSPQVALKNYYEYLKDIRKNNGMESITDYDMVMLDKILADVVHDPQKYNLEEVSSLFSLIEQLAASESFADPEVKDMALRQIQLYRIELAIK